ncbi:uncharacterized protein [Triticum aestivum]|uniref:uncharacterized protein n=1 Tax=Triticum aestivum TaxID=4565 RepID=UPI001D0107DB|nr:uncharacterized protein LOC123063361 [Triticum aestivum]
MALELAAACSQQNVSMVAPSQDEYGLDPIDHESDYDQTLKISKVMGEVEENMKISKDYMVQLPHPHCEEIIPTPPLAPELPAQYSSSAHVYGGEGRISGQCQKSERSTGGRRRHATSSRC